MDTLRDIRRLRRRVRVGAPDPSLTPVSGMAAVLAPVAGLSSNDLSGTHTVSR